MKPGEVLHGGTVIAEVQETHAILHKCMVPPDMEGTVISVVSDGQYTINDVIVTMELLDGSRKELTMMQKWPIRVPRPVHHRYPASVPLITGQRILDTDVYKRQGKDCCQHDGYDSFHLSHNAWCNSPCPLFIILARAAARI